jgi:tetratricopeptide (TPR) repeat protein
MLETVREFGRLQLQQAGEESEARAAVRRWAVSYARAHADALNSREQFAAIDAVSAEEVNLADELRLATAEGDAATVAQLLTALGMFWTIRGEHARMLAIADAITGVLAGWQPPAALEGVAGAAIAILLTNTMIAGGGRIGQLREQLRKLAGRVVTFPVFRLVASMVALDPADADASRARLAELAADPDHDVAVAASQWLAGMRENDGDLAGAINAAQRALAIVNDDDGPWSRALSNDMLARLLMHVGDADAAVGHARAALPVLQRLGATDDEVQNRSLLVNAAIAGGDLAGAQAGLEQIEEITRAGTVFGGMSHAQTGRAELLLARGEHARGLALYRECAEQLQEFEMPGVPRSGLEPWTLYGAAVALTAHAHYAGPADEADGRALFEDCRRYALAVLGGQSWTPEGAPGAPFIELDLPVAGMLLFALGAWSLLHAAAPPGEDLHLLALAERFAYNRSVPSMAWERILPAAEQAAPGLLEEYRARYAGARPASLLARAREVVAALP